MSDITHFDMQLLSQVCEWLNNREGTSCRLVETDERLFPMVDNATGDIHVSQRLQLPLLLFTAYHNVPDEIEEMLFWYLLANKHIEGRNLNHADYCLDTLDNFTRNAQLKLMMVDTQGVRLDIQATAILAHEFGHYVFHHDRERLAQYESGIREIIVGTMPKGLKGLLAKRIVKPILSDAKMMEELACDCYAMEAICERLHDASQPVDDLEETLRQVVWLFISFKFLEEIMPYRELSRKRWVFNFLRTAIVSVVLNNEFGELTAATYAEELRIYKARHRQARRNIIATLRFHHYQKLQPSFQNSVQLDDVRRRLKEQEDRLLSSLMPIDWYTASLGLF